MTVIRYPFPAAIAEREAEFDEPLAALDRLAVYVEPEIAAAYRPTLLAYAVAFVGLIGVIATVCGFGALAYGVFG